MIKEGAAVIDVGITRVQDPVTAKSRLVGDVDFEGTKGSASASLSTKHLRCCAGEEEVLVHATEQMQTNADVLLLGVPNIISHARVRPSCDTPGESCMLRGQRRLSLNLSSRVALPLPQFKSRSTSDE